MHAWCVGPQWRVRVIIAAAFWGRIDTVLCRVKGWWADLHPAQMGKSQLLDDQTRHWLVGALSEKNQLRLNASSVWNKLRLWLSSCRRSAFAIQSFGFTQSKSSQLRAYFCSISPVSFHTHPKAKINFEFCSQEQKRNRRLRDSNSCSRRK